MIWKQSFRIIRKVISVMAVLGVLLAVMIMFFDYSAQLPFIIVISIVIIEYILFAIFVKRVRVRLISKEGNFVSSSSVRLEVAIHKRSFYPFKRMEVNLCHHSKYGERVIRKKMDIELKDKRNQTSGFTISNLPYGYTDVMIDDIYIYDFMGLGRRILKGYEEQLKVFVMPQRKDVYIEMPKIPYVGGDETEIFLEDRGKDSSEQYEIREFRDGDKIRQIHWKLSSKMDDYMVRDSVMAVETNIYVFFDLCNTKNINTILEDAVSVAYKMLKLKYAFYVTWLDVESMRMRRILVTEEGQIDTAVMEVLKSPLYEKNGEIQYMLERFLNENHEVYNLFILS